MPYEGGNVLYNTPGVTMFPLATPSSSYNAAAMYYKQLKTVGLAPYLFAYQNTAPMANGTIPAPIHGAINYATLAYSPHYTQWFWQYANHGDNEAKITGVPQMVYHKPLIVNDLTKQPTLGLPTGFATTIFGVYVKQNGNMSMQELRPGQAPAAGSNADNRSVVP